MIGYRDVFFVFRKLFDSAYAIEDDGVVMYAHGFQAHVTKDCGHITTNLPILPGFQYSTKFSSLGELYGNLVFAKTRFDKALTSPKTKGWYEPVSIIAESLLESSLFWIERISGKFFPRWGAQKVLGFHENDDLEGIKESCLLGEKLLHYGWYQLEDMYYTSKDVGLLFQYSGKDASKNAFQIALQMETEILGLQ